MQGSGLVIFGSSDSNEFRRRHQQYPATAAAATTKFSSKIASINKIYISIKKIFKTYLIYVDLFKITHKNSSKHEKPVWWSWFVAVLAAEEEWWMVDFDGVLVFVVVVASGGGGVG